MRQFLLGGALFLLTGCFADRSDLEQFVADTKAKHVAGIPSLQPPPEFQHFSYQAGLLRSPFVPPSRELTEEVVATERDCLRPDVQRRKGQLESYALDNLTMRGTLQQGEDIWALVQSGDGNVYRLGIGDYLGLYHGQIIQISPRNIAITELIPDGAGCWSERASSMELTTE